MNYIYSLFKINYFKIHYLKHKNNLWHSFYNLVHRPDIRNHLHKSPNPHMPHDSSCLMVDQRSSLQGTETSFNGNSHRDQI